MSTVLFASRRRRLFATSFAPRLLAWGLAALGASAALPAHAAATIDLADTPLFSTVSVPGNLILALSVEWPTATTPAYPVSTDYSPSGTFLGYFDPGKCYVYNYVAKAPATSYFAPVKLAKNHACDADGTQWSGNYLNWAAMQTLDAFRWVLTGGYRSVDSPTETILTKTYAATQGNASRNPDKTLAANLKGTVPMSSWSSVVSSVKGQGIALLITGTGVKATRDNSPGLGCLKSTAQNPKVCVDSSSPNIVDYGKNDAKLDPSVIYRLYINVKVCDAKVGLEDNCKAYAKGYKPEGLMQLYASNLRYAAFGYLNDSDARRDGGVLRARMGYIGPTKPVPGAPDVVNPDAEWDASTGVMLPNPHRNDASATAAALGLPDSDIASSGAMNYLNKFGNAGGGYKSGDPVGELYYAALRYYKHIGNVAAYTDMSGATQDQKRAYADGFPVITRWDDPIAYSCQSNFILGIGDVNTHNDANLRGSTIRGSDEPAIPDEVSSDKSVDVTAATNMVGQLEGYAGLGAAKPLPAFNDTYFIAGLAYDAHTTDIRPDDLPGTQTVNTYWMDVLENQVYNHKNQYWLAAKYGGFSVPPKGFSPYASKNGPGTIDETRWYTNSDTLTPTTAGSSFNPLTYSMDAGATSDKRPDNYFPGDRPAAMKDGLTQAFAKISHEMQAATSTSFSGKTPNVANGAASYGASYDPKTWTSDLIASSVTFDAKGSPTLSAPLWNAGTLLAQRSYAKRLIVTCCTKAGKGVPFEDADLSAADLIDRTYYDSFAHIAGVASGSQSAANYLAYLRGDRSHEIGWVKEGGVYRHRESLLGDIVGSKVNPVGPPSAALHDVTNAGYSAFKKRFQDRKTVVYVGANDGMLHAFDGAIPSSKGADCSDCGSELFAYVPSFVYGDASTAASKGLASLGSPNFAHHFLVDATPQVFDLDLNKTAGSKKSAPDWHSVLIGGLGKGGKGYYAIDVTDPKRWTSETAISGNVMWEFTDSRMGYSYGAPIVVKTARYGWVAIFTSGYNNADGVGYFFIVNPASGALLQAVATPEGTPATPINMAQATAYIADYTDYTADAVYAGDLQGNLWRLDLTGSADYAAPVKLAKLARGSTPQPVTTRLLTEIDPKTKKRYVLVGTGRLLGDSDIKNGEKQGFYAIVDGLSAFGKFYGANNPLPAGARFPLTRADLTPNTDLLNGIGSNPSSSLGWYVDLNVDSVTGIAERVNVTPAANDGVVAFAANLPSGEVCNPEGTNRSFAISFASGKTALQSDDGSHLVTSSQAVSGVVTDVAFLRVNGKLRLVAGGSQGSPVQLPAQLTAAQGLKMLTWRAVPAVN